MMDTARITDYLCRWAQRPLTIVQIAQLGGGVTGAAALKAFGYGSPLGITYRVNDTAKRVVLRRVKRNGFGRERDSDRVAEVWRDFHTFNLLPRHIQARDMLVEDKNGRLDSIAHATDLLLLTDYAPGHPYANDLYQLQETEACTDLDRERAQALATYLAQIHAVKENDPLLWRRRLRDLVGHGEGIMGLADSYGYDHPVATPARLQAIETAANRWRWRLKPHTARLSQIHGDFHPFNILFSTGTTFNLIDRSRGEWGEPADDVSCLMINYLFFSLQQQNQLSGAYQQLYDRFWQAYLQASQDQELLAIIAPWISWRALVLASPQWYPDLTNSTRQRLFNLAENVLADQVFTWQDINRYLESP